MQGPTSFLVLQAQQIQISANGVAGNGIFVYNPTPGPGNLVGAWVAVAGPDRFGNNTLEGITVINNTFGTTAQLDAASLNFFSGVNQRLQLNNNGLSIFNSSGALVFAVDVTRDATFLYTDTGSATQGDLVDSNTPTAGTDSFGNTVYSGIVNYLKSSGVVKQVAQLFAGALNLGTPAQMAGTGGALPVQIQNDPVSTAGLVITSGQASSTDVPAQMFLESKANAGTGTPIINLDSVVFLPNNVPTPNPVAVAGLLWADSNGFLRSFSSSDQNKYALDRLTVVLGSNFTINSTSAQTILSAPVAAATYEIEVWLVVNNNVNGAAGEAIFQLLGPAAAVNPQLVDFTTKTTGTATVGYGANATNFAATFPDQGVNVPQSVEFKATVQFTAAGTFQVTGKETTAGDTITVFGGSRMRICPV